MNALDPAVQRQVEALGIAHEVVDCDPSLADTEAFCAHYGIPRENAANAIIVAAKSEPRQYAACVVLATTKIDVNHKLSKIMGIKRLSFAGAEETAALTGQMIGGVTVFALPESLPVYVDARVMEAEYVIVCGGNRSTKITPAPAEVRKVPGAQVVDIAMPRDQSDPAPPS